MVEQLTAFIEKFPFVSILIAIIVSIYHGYRGYVLQRITVKIQKNEAKREENSWPWTKTEIFFVRYIYDALFYFFCSFLGFIALWIAIMIINAHASSVQNISGGASALFVFFIIVAILGLSGQLPQLIQQGKLPK